jgi:hypothetical protein
MSFSPQNLGPDQYEECARVVSVVMFKYDFPRDNFFYSAETVMKCHSIMNVKPYMSKPAVKNITARSSFTPFILAYDIQ